MLPEVKQPQQKKNIFYELQKQYIYDLKKKKIFGSTFIAFSYLK